ncbi:ABC transporter substrate-binding protein [Mycetocola reblochoni]|uniref:Dipeptide-binding ABC transporter, periplasmic substrate-binding component (TC 3.A.1.5.2) n=1 Tax=Mycetocola reblochoni REB411 TaxID=1255698 RepID=A0A1R4IWM4_9MICO|nr:ABC transporter substrate-binding protein [Mycetocola reblochoni]SJN23733.1 Dipeptide-binding ABC transporter, periplasmic substrate-binding component (TC 3.A.1.5.2) [Mycetocola reblochoni REB411]
MNAFSPGRRTRRLIPSILALAVTGSLLTACTASTDASSTASVEDPTVIVALPTEPTVFDPNRQYSYDTFRIDRHIYETLITEDLSTPAEDGTPELVPGLAESWDVSDDGRTFTFHLREGVTFSDGTPFDAEALDVNVRRFTDPDFEYFDEESQARMSGVFATLESTEVVDDHTFSYTFTDPFLAFPRYVAQGNYVQGVFSPAALEEYGNDGLADHPVGTGPYTFVERKANDHTTLERNDDYWGDAPVAEKLIFRTITDESARASALRTGDVDIIANPPADAIDELAQSGYGTPDNLGAANIDFYAFNWANEAVQDVRVRQAIIKAIDRQGLVDTVYSGHAAVARNIYPLSNEAFDEGQTDADFDPDGARALLEEAGYEDGELSLAISTYVPKTAEYIQSNLEDVGIDVEVRTSDWLTFSQNIADPGDDVALQPMSWGLLTADWLRVAYSGYVTRIGDGGQYIDAAVPEAIDAAAANADQDSYVQSFQEANQLAIDEALWVPLASPSVGWAYSDRVTGFVSPGQNWVDLTTVGLSE